MSDIVRVETISQIHDFLGIEKPKHPLVSVVRFTKELMEKNFIIDKFVLDLYQVTYKGGMSGSLGYGRNSYDFQEGTLMFTKPGQVISINEPHNIESEPNGWVLLFHPDLIRKSELGKHISKYSFFSYDVNEALHISDDEKQTIFELLEKIVKEYSMNIDKHSQKLIISNIELLLDYCTRYYDRQFYVRSNMNKDIVTKFEDLLENYYNSNKLIEAGIPSVKYCGEELNMSSNYLSDMLKKETGRNAQEHIHFFLVDKAKTKLLNSGDTVSQIAFDLGFEYPQHFSKIFKKKTGMSPAEYRQMN